MSAIKQGLAEFLTEKHALERRLGKLIAAELSAFTELTGVTVKAVNIDMAEVRLIGAPIEYRVSTVRAFTPLN
jgi:hypothetical protein